MAQAVIRRPVTAESRARSRVSLCRIYGGQSGTGTDFSPSTSVFPCQFHTTGAPLHEKTKKTLIIFIKWLHNKSQGYSAPVASAAGLFNNKKVSEIHLFVPSYGVLKIKAYVNYCTCRLLKLAVTR
jgi:hypothetical protein